MSLPKPVRASSRPRRKPAWAREDDTASVASSSGRSRISQRKLMLSLTDVDGGDEALASSLPTRLDARDRCGPLEAFQLLTLAARQSPHPGSPRSGRRRWDSDSSATSSAIPIPGRHGRSPVSMTVESDDEAGGASFGARSRSKYLTPSSVAFSDEGTDQRRLFHNERERNRRTSIRQLFETLRINVPAVEGQETTSDRQILVEAARYIEELNSEHDRLEHAVAELRAEHEVLVHGSEPTADESLDAASPDDEDEDDDDYQSGAGGPDDSLDMEGVSPYGGHLAGPAQALSLLLNAAHAVEEVDAAAAIAALATTPVL